MQKKKNKAGANKEGEYVGEAHAVTAIPIQPSFPPTQQCRYLANNQPSPYPPPSYPRRPSLKQPQSLSTALPMRMSITALPYSLRADKPKVIMHMSLKPWRRHMKFPTTIQPTPSLASDMPLKGKQLLIYPCKTHWRALSITHNYTFCK